MLMVVHVCFIKVMAWLIINSEHLFFLSCLVLQFYESCGWLAFLVGISCLDSGFLGLSIIERKETKWRNAAHNIYSQDLTSVCFCEYFPI